MSRALLTSLTDLVSGNVQDFASRRPMSPAARHVDWDVVCTEASGVVAARFYAHSPEGALFLAELAAAGLFDSLHVPTAVISQIEFT